LTLTDYVYNLHVSRTKGSADMRRHGPWPQTLLSKFILYFQTLDGQYFFNEQK